ncbi:phage portal protein [Rhodococcus sp. NPDC003994]
MRLHNAWYTGATADLESYYTQTKISRPVHGRGILGRIQRFFWGRPNPQGNNRLHVPAAADLARTSADLLFSSPPKFKLGELDRTGAKAGRDAAQQRIDLILNGDDMAATLLEAAEVGSALGGSYLRLWWDREVEERVVVGSVSPDRAIPNFRYDRLAGVTFWTVVADDNGHVLRHLERHEPGRILHGLYEGDGATLGRPIPLTEHSATEWAAGIVDADGGITTNVPGLTAAYVPNVRPNRQYRNVAGLQMLGRSDFDGLEPMFDALDEAYTSWMRDIDLGKARLFVDEGLILDDGPGKGSNFDSEQQIFTPLKEQLGSGMDGGSSGVQANQFSIRWQEHRETCNEILNAILRGAGLSTQGFTDSDTSATAVTATQVNSEDQLSERTRKKKMNYWKMGVRPLAMTAMQIDAQQFGSGVELQEPPEMAFPTRSSQSPLEMAQSLSSLRTASIISIRQSIVERNPDWDDEQVDAELALIEGDQAAALGPPLEGDGFGDGDGENTDDPFAKGSDDTDDDAPTSNDDEKPEAA